MATLASLSTLPKILLCLCLPLSIALLSLASLTTAALSTLVLLPPAIFLWLCSHSAPPGLLDKLTWTFLGTGTVGLVAVAAVQACLSYAYAYVLFGTQAPDYFAEFQRTSIDDLTTDEKLKRVKMAHNWRYIVFLVLFTFTAAGFLEEALKYLAISFATQTPGGEYEYFQCAIAATLGFSVVENIGFIYGARNENIPMTALTVLERIVIGMPAHALSGCLIATGMVHRDLRGGSSSFWQIVAAPTLYHGTFDFVLFALCAVRGNVGWIHPKDFRSMAVMLALILTVLGAASLHLRYNTRTIEPWPEGGMWNL